MTRTVRLGSLAAALATCVIGTSLATAGEQGGRKTNCGFDPTTSVLSISVGSELGVTLKRVGDAMTVSYIGDNFEFVDIPCSGGESTVTNTDTAAFYVPAGFGDLWVDLGGGQFAPGATAETDGTPEIEIKVTRGPNAFFDIFVLGTDGPDSIRAGQLREGTGVNLDASAADRDADLTFSGAPADPLIDGAGGPDRISMNGGQGFKGPYPRGSIPEGGPGNDHLTGGDYFDSIYGDSGHDVIHARGGGDIVYARDGSKDEIFCGSRIDQAKVDAHDRLHSCERANIGKPGH